MMSRTSLLVITFLLLKGTAAQAFFCIEWTPGKCTYWGDRRATMSSALGTAGVVFINGTTTWDQNTTGAANDWNSVGTVQFTSTTVLNFSDPCGGRDGRNHMCDNTGPLGSNPVFFSQSFCGRGFGDVIELTNNCWDSGSGRMLNAPVFVNANVSWNAYDGAQRFSGGIPVYDIRRVLLHELGHVLGLDHPDGHSQTVQAIMNSHVSNLDRLQADDINGARAIYASVPSQPSGSLTGTSGCAMQSGSAGGGLWPWLSVAVLLVVARSRNTGRPTPL